MKRIQQLNHALHTLSTQDMCNLFLAMGFTLLILGRFFDQNSFVGFMIENGGWIVFLCGIAMFVALARRTLNY